jgi:predicted RNase H-like HicB family nuclease
MDGLTCVAGWRCGGEEKVRDNLNAMKTYTAVVERDAETGLYVGFIPGLPGAHSQADSLDELKENLQEVIEMLLEDGEPQIQTEFVGTQLIHVG